MQEGVWVMITEDMLTIFAAGMVVGVFVHYVISAFHEKQAMDHIIELAKMRILADSGRDPMIVEAAKNHPSMDAPSREDGIEDLNKKVKERYGEDYEVM